MFTGNSPDGRCAMREVLNVAVAAAVGNDYDQMLVRIPDIFSTEDKDGEDNCFIKVKKKWLGALPQYLLIPDDLSAALTRCELN